MDKRIIEGIEACRPGSQDLQSAELADVARAIEQDPAARQLYDRVQQWDAAISATMDDVVVPPGLDKRLLERLRGVDAVDASKSHPSSDELRSTGAVEPAPKPDDEFPSTRRRWLSLSMGGALAATVLIAAGFFLTRSPTEIPLETLADDWLKQVTANPQAWRDVPSPPAAFAVPPNVLAVPVGWQPIGRYAKGVAYKLEHSKGGQAMLYAVRLLRPGLPTAPPGAPQSTTGGKAIGYWGSGGIIYVLVVPGDERNYRAFVRSAPVPLA